MLIFVGVLFVVASRAVFEFMTVPAVCYIIGTMVMHACIRSEKGGGEGGGDRNAVTMMVRGTVDALDCPICLEYAAEPAALVCGHAFHKDCVGRWLTVSRAAGTCPICRRAAYWF